MGISPDAHVPGSKAEDAFEEFVRGRSTHLFRLALVLTGWDRAAAEDVLQIALERAYRRGGCCSGRDRPSHMSAGWW